MCWAVCVEERSEGRSDIKASLYLLSRWDDVHGLDLSHCFHLSGEQPASNTNRNFEGLLSHTPLSCFHLNSSDSRYKSISILAASFFFLLNLMMIMGARSQQTMDYINWVGNFFCLEKIHSACRTRQKHFFVLRSLFLNINPRAGGQEGFFAQATKIHEKNKAVLYDPASARWATGRQRGASVSVQQGSTCSPSCCVPSVSSVWLDH